jgi:O-antigen/teichoic acid export membrane protein
MKAVYPETKRNSRQILLNTLSSYGNDFLDAVTLIILTPFLIRALGQESFGLWSLLWSFLNLFELIDMGFGTSVVKYVADTKGRNDIESRKKIVCTLFWVYGILGMTLIIGVSGSLFFFNEIFDIPDTQKSAAHIVLIMLGIRSALCMPFGMFRGVLVGYQKMRVANLYKALATLFYFVAVLIVLSPSNPIPEKGPRPDPDVVNSRIRSLTVAAPIGAATVRERILRTLKLTTSGLEERSEGRSLSILALLNLLMGVLPVLAMMVHAKLTLPGITVHPRYFDRSVIRQVSAFSFYFMLIEISLFIYTRVDFMIIKSFLPLEMVAVYAIAMRLSDKAQQFCFHLVRTLTPVVAELYGAGDQKHIRVVWQWGTKLSVAFATPLLVGLIVLAEPLIKAWTGSGFELAILACQWLGAAALINVIHGNTANILSMGGEQKYLAFSMLGSQLFNLVLSVLLIRPFGIVGVAMATFFSSLLLQIGLTQTRASKIHGWSLINFYHQTVFPSILPALFMVSLIWGIERFWPVTRLLEVAMLELTGTLAFIGVFWLVGLTAQEQAYFKGKIFYEFTH